MSRALPPRTAYSGDSINRNLSLLRSARAAPVPNTVAQSLVPRPQRQPEDDTQAALSDMSLPSQIVERLAPFFDKEGLKAEVTTVSDRYDARVVRSYTRVQREGGSFAVLHLPGWLLDGSAHIGTFDQAIFNIRSGDGRIVSEGLDNPYRTWTELLKSWSTNGVLWTFIGWNDVRECFVTESLTCTRTFYFDLASPVAAAKPAKPAPTNSGTSPVNLQLSQADRDRIVEIVAGLQNILDVSITNLADGAGLPESWKKKIAAGLKADVDASARHFLACLLVANRYSNGHQRYGDTYLGWTLKKLIEDEPGSPADEDCARIILKYALIQSDATALAEIRTLLPEGA